MIMQNLGGGGGGGGGEGGGGGGGGGWGVNKVYYALCENGKFAIFIFYSSLFQELDRKKKSWLSTTKRQFIITAIGLAEHS